ncbi:MAG: tRNA dihydrouridine synthase DusB [Lachnospiraceae bacterium]|nr:tRNA dihydrouridine synthase DusB [Lachnospiraceae bacterium]
MKMRIGNIDVGFLSLGPMAGVTDMPFRILCKEQGADLIYTEMVSAKGIHYNNTNTKDMLLVDEAERPTALQLFGSEPDIMAETAKRIEDRNFDIFDINMGCPVPKVVNNGEGSAMMKDVKTASAVVSAIVKAVKKPVTVKIRKGFGADDANAPEFAKAMEEAGAAAIAVHGRTREQYYSGKADWDIIAKVKQTVSIPVIGNGDIFTPQDAERMLKYTGCDGIMVARGAQGNPWIFKNIKDYFKAKGILTGEVLKPDKGQQDDTGIYKYGKPAFEEVRAMIARHLDMLISFKGEWTAIREMRSHIAWYTEGFPYSAGLRRDINQCQSRDEILEYLISYGERLCGR